MEYSIQLVLRIQGHSVATMAVEHGSRLIDIDPWQAAMLAASLFPPPRLLHVDVMSGAGRRVAGQEGGRYS